MTTHDLLNASMPILPVSTNKPESWMQPSVTHYVFWQTTTGTMRATPIGPSYRSSAEPQSASPAMEILRTELAPWLAAGEDTLTRLDDLTS